MFLFTSQKQAGVEQCQAMARFCKASLDFVCLAGSFDFLLLVWPEYERANILLFTLKYCELPLF